MPNERLEWLELERRLRYWAAMVEPRERASAAQLRAAATVLARGQAGLSAAQRLPGWDRELGTVAADEEDGGDT